MLARCYEGAGRLASAWSGYLVAQSAAAQAKRPELERQARERGAALKPKLAQLTIKVPEAMRGVPGLSITRDELPVGAAQWETPVPVDKGKHLVVATAPGKQRWEREVDVPANGAAVSLSVDVLADAPATAVEASAPAPTFWGGQHVAGAAIAGGGLLGVILGTAFGALAIAKKNQSNDGPCVLNACDAMGIQLRDAGLTAASVSTGTFIAGGIALAAGVTLLAVRWQKPVEARVGFGPGAMSFSAAW
jgi:hypothetical protein